MRNPFDCPGCAQRRAAIAAAGRKMTDWMRRPGDAPLPMDIAPRSVQLPDHVVEVRALARFLIDNAGATESDWRNATEELRASYRANVKAGL